MSAITRLLIRCDHCAREDVAECRTESKLRSDAARRGWQRTARGDDVCPDCVEKLRGQR